MKMTRFFLLATLLLQALPSMSQAFTGAPDGPMLSIARKDGSILNPAAIFLDSGKKVVRYVVRGEKEKSAKFEDLTAINIGEDEFRIFEANKFRGYFIKTEVGDKILATFPSKFQESVAWEITVAILDAKGNILESLDMRRVNKPAKDIEKRRAVAEMVKKAFADCPKFLDYFSNFDYESDAQKMQIYHFFDMHNYVNCK